MLGRSSREKLRCFCRDRFYVLKWLSQITKHKHLNLPEGNKQCCVPLLSWIFLGINKKQIRAVTNSKTERKEKTKHHMENYSVLRVSLGSPISALCFCFVEGWKTYVWYLWEQKSSKTNDWLAVRQHNTELRTTSQCWGEHVQVYSSQRHFDCSYFTEVWSMYMTDVGSSKANYILLFSTDATCPLLVAYDLNKGSQTDSCTDTNTQIEHILSTHFFFFF